MGARKKPTAYIITLRARPPKNPKWARRWYVDNRGGFTRIWPCVKRFKDKKIADAFADGMKSMIAYDSKLEYRITVWKESDLLKQLNQERELLVGL